MKCKNPNGKCSFSTSIAGYITAGWGELDEYGYWEHACPACAARANAAEARRLEEERSKASSKYACLEKAAADLLADVRRRYPGEELQCPYMRALDSAVKGLQNE